MHISFFIFCLIGHAVASGPRCFTGWKDTHCKEPIIQITVSPLLSKTTLRVLDIAWDVDQWQNGDRVELTDGKQTLFKHLVNGSKGWVRTNIQEERKLVTTPSFDKTCERFIANYWTTNNSKPFVSKCLSNNPRWMEESKDIIKDLSLRDLFIPGSHNAGSFFIAYKPIAIKEISTYVYNQDEIVLEQLLHGARYLDLRVSYLDGEWWLNHDVVHVHPLEPILDDIILFLNNTKEIVLLDFHRFPSGFDNPEMHHRFVHYLKEKLKNVMAPPFKSWSTTLAQLWSSDRRLVVSYNEEEIVKKNYNTLWEPIPQKWPNANSIEKLKKYFDKIFEDDCVNAKNVWASMMPLTPSNFDVVFGIMFSIPTNLRVLADRINHNVTQWFWDDWGAKCNVVAVDFIRSTGIVDAAISWNKRRAKNTYCINKAN